MAPSQDGSTKEAWMKAINSTSRRSIVAALGAGSLGLALSPTGTSARNANAAQEASLAEHPLVGVWLVMVALPSAPDAPVAVTSIYTADGIVAHAFPATDTGPQGVTHKSAAIGTWEQVDERTGHFTTVQVLSTADGAFSGTITLAGYPQVSDDGQTFHDENPEGLVVIRDATNAILSEIPGGSAQPVRGYRMAPGSVTFPEPGSQAAAASIPTGVGPSEF